MTIMISPKALPVALNLHARTEDTLFGQSKAPFSAKIDQSQYGRTS